MDFFAHHSENEFFMLYPLQLDQFRDYYYLLPLTVIDSYASLIRALSAYLYVFRCPWVVCLTSGMI